MTDVHRPRPPALRRRRGHRARAASARVALAMAIAGAVAAMAWSWSVGGDLGRPPLQPKRWGQWWSARDPLDAVAAVASVVAVVALGWLVLVAAVHLGATFWGLGGLRHGTARLLPPLLRTLVASAALGTATLGSTALGSAALGVAFPTAVAADPAPPLDDPPPTMVQLDPARPTGAATDPAAPDAIPSPEEPDPSATPAPSLRVTVKPGDHLWGIAAARLRLALGAEADAEQIRPYWSALVEANRDRLVDPDDPDLLVPGQELVLPG